ncbi:MAG TPA: glycosyltransferase [Armatimonadota bacterium]|nr:glycosyltransferase [Armatimonadota bacterium]
MRVSIILTTCNRPRSLLLSMLSLARQDRPPDEIVIADDGSGPETAEVVRRVGEELPIRIEHAWHDDLGWRVAATRNNGVRASSGEYLIFVDGDVLADRGLVAAHVEQAGRGRFLLGNALRLDEATSACISEDDVRSGRLGLPLLQEAKSRLSKVHRRNQWHLFLRRLHLCKRHKPKLVGLNFSLYRSDLERVNGFDEDFVGWGQEDDDLGMRLMLAGVRPKSIAPCAIAFHLYHASSASPAWHDSENSQRLFRLDRPTFCDNGLVRSGE